MNRLSLSGLAAVVLVSACSPVSSVARKGAEAIEPTQQAEPIVVPAQPPQRECLFPTASELADLARRSEVILLGRIPTPGRVLHPDSGTVTEYMIYPQNVIKPVAVEVLDREVNTALPEEIQSIGVPLLEAGGVPTRLFDVGMYVFYLKHPGQYDPRRDSLNVLRPETPYYVTDGMFGAFPVREQFSKEDPVDLRVHRECPNYGDPSKPHVAADLPNGMALTEFLELAKDSAEQGS